MDKEAFEKIEENIAAKRDEFETKGEEFVGKLKDAKEGWEDSHAEGNHAAKIAHQEETHQTH
ncbi:hypothetical protein [Bifidobacterium magnum]|uniref:Uncharacterized protein n=1 Tax=Bifidobacterium magnum TaxID=1692 RepID=A0A087BEP6_9BIFI|nr:hypothetical protein [Bifidobacterium magnum]KFI69496.1 hypothetical protein BMAGN_1205 [Bifidobacterium magnum]